MMMRGYWSCVCDEYKYRIRAVMEYHNDFAKLISKQIDKPNEGNMIAASDLGKKMLRNGVPPEEIGEMLHISLGAVSKQNPNLSLKDTADPLATLLTELLMAYGLSFRKRIEKKDLEVELLRRWAGVFEYTQMGVVLCDTSELIIKRTNPAFNALFKTSAQLLKNIQLSSLFKNDYLAELNRHIQEANIHGHSTFESVCKSREGDELQVIVNLSRLKYESNDINLMSVIFGDISQWKKSEREKRKLQAMLRQAQKMEAIGTLAGGIAHDFNNILAAIMGYSELALDMAKEGEATPKELEMILQASDRGNGLVKKILAFSRKVEPQLIAADIKAEVQFAIDLIKQTLPRMLNIQLQLPDKMKPVMIDPIQIQQVIINLCTNASDAMPNGGQLNIKIEEKYIAENMCTACGDSFSGDYVVIEISDTGCGMDDKTLERIFDPFFTTKNVGKGTGMGLSTVFGLVSGHEGHIQCRSQLGAGTTFAVYLPTCDDVLHEITNDSPLTELSCSGGATILIVDDEEALRVLFGRVLQRSGYQTMMADSGEKAIEILKQTNGDIDLTIMDLSMPGMGGHSALKEILEHNPKAKVIINSGYPLRRDSDYDDLKGAAGHIVKPVKFDELIRTVQRVLTG
jgi:two-component system cell cycle sensor histidine kinase/response regulator CckA